MDNKNLNISYVYIYNKYIQICKHLLTLIFKIIESYFYLLFPFLFSVYGCLVYMFVYIHFFRWLPG